MKPPAPPPQQPLLPGQCPRCGGWGKQPRKVTKANPFLRRSTPEMLVCEDCGLDFPQTKPKAGGRPGE